MRRGGSHGRARTGSADHGGEPRAGTRARERARAARRAAHAGRARGRGPRACDRGAAGRRHRGVRLRRRRRRQARDPRDRGRRGGAGGTHRRAGPQREHARRRAARTAARHRVRGSRARARRESRWAVPAHEGDRRLDGVARKRKLARSRDRHQLRRGDERVSDVGRVRRLEGRARSPAAHLGGRAARGEIPLDRSGRDGHRHARGRDARCRSRGAREACRRREAHRGADRHRPAAMVASLRMMSPATFAEKDPRLLVLDPASGVHVDARVRDLGRFLRAGDLLVVNDAATLPASIPARLVNGAWVEIRLVSRRTDGRWRGVRLGGGDWRTPTEKRPAPPAVLPGDTLVMGERFVAVVSSISAISPRLVELSFDADDFWRELYSHAQPVQYAYLREALELWDVQTPYATRPWAGEAPSAARPLRWSLLAASTSHGHALATLTHAAGLSSSGDAAIDAALPFAEAYEIPPATIDAIFRATRVIAAGTTVVRALESWAATGLAAGETELRLSAASR